MKRIFFSGSSNVGLSRQIAKKITAKTGKAEIKQFSDHEIYVRIKENIKNQEVWVMQSCAHRPHYYLMELLILVDALNRLKPKKINLVLTFYPYRRQDRINTAGESLAAELIAKILSRQPIDQFFITELHTDKITDFFTKPIKHIRTWPIFTEYYQKKFANFKNVAVASPDLGASDEAAGLAAALNVPHIEILKSRPRHEEVTIEKLSGQIKGKKIILLDDEINTGSTILEASEALQKNGARAIYVAAAHGIFSGGCLPKLQASFIQEVAVTNSIKQNKSIKKLKVINIADMIAKSIN